MKGELKVPGALMQEYHQFDGRPIEVRMGPQGFAVEVICIARPVDPWNAYFLTPDIETLKPPPPPLQFRLTHMREYDDTLVYELQP